MGGMLTGAIYALRNAPVPVRKYIENLLTGDTQVVLSEFSPEARKLLKKIVNEHGVSSIDLKTTNSISDKYKPKNFSGLDHVLSPYGELRNTLGAFKIIKNPKTGELFVEDTYDWTDDHSERGLFTDGLTLNTAAKVGHMAQEGWKSIGVNSKKYKFPTGVFLNRSRSK